MRTTFLTALAVLSVGVSTIAFAQTSNRDVVSDDNKNVVTNSFGNCVHTKWESAGDPCAPKAPAPVVKKVVAAPQPVIEKEARTVYFDFDKAELNAEGRAKLDALAETIVHSRGIISADVVGYTDKIGTSSYNLKLSQRRAAAVKRYLDTKVKIPTSVAEVRGLGKLDHPTGCDKMKNRKEKIACLRPDRRVEVEFKYQEK